MRCQGLIRHQGRIPLHGPVSGLMNLAFNCKAASGDNAANTAIAVSDNVFTPALRGRPVKMGKGMP